MEIGLSEFVKLSPLQATLAVVFGRLRLPSRYEAPPEIADRIEPSIDGASGEPRVMGRADAPRRIRNEPVAVERRQPYIADPVAQPPRAAASAGDRSSAGAGTADADTAEHIDAAEDGDPDTTGLLTLPRARVNRR